MKEPINFFQDFTPKLYKPDRIQGFGIILTTSSYYDVGLITSCTLLTIYGQPDAEKRAKNIKEWFKNHPAIEEEKKYLLLLGCSTILEQYKYRPGRMRLIIDGKKIDPFNDEFIKNNKYYFPLSQLEKFYKNFNNFNFPELDKYKRKIKTIIKEYKTEFGFADKERLVEKGKWFLDGPIGKTKFNSRAKLYLKILRDELTDTEECKVNLKKLKRTTNLKQASKLLQELLELFGVEISLDYLRKLNDKKTCLEN
ncbi:hypothetical protein JXQ31_17005 [candidate division KSB1 bacterium]|nr:hypothetical protein [candidate division KSB1 bacterium]